MDYRLLYTQKALSDFAEILAWIAEDDAEAASRFGASVLDHINLLTKFPLIGTTVGKRRSVRKLVHSPILVYYSVNENKHTINVLHLRHGARKPPRTEIESGHV